MSCIRSVEHHFLILEGYSSSGNSYFGWCVVLGNQNLRNGLRLHLICMQMEENINHLHFHCSVASEFWSFVLFFSTL